MSLGREPFPAPTAIHPLAGKDRLRSQAAEAAAQRRGGVVSVENDGGAVFTVRLPSSAPVIA